jgi:tetratricopeptide (TPR) repeat protein
MLPNEELLLIDHLDKNLSAEESIRVEAMIRHDKSAAESWEYLKMAVEAVELSAIREQVMAIRRSVSAEPAAEVPVSGSIMRRMYKTGLRIAAVLILLMGVSIFYKYNTVSNTSVYRQYFTDYNLNTSRGASHPDAMDEAYRSQNWSGVIAAFNQSSEKTNKSYFLAGVADMKMQKFADAVAHFENILATNARSGGTYFQDEAEYYLALAYLMNKETAKGVSLLNKIGADTSQTYYPLARQISSTDLKIIELKDKK